MTVYLLGSRGPAVLQIQKRLTALGFYGGVLDEIFWGGTDSAIRNFQQSKDMTVDGRVGPETWGALFNGADVPVLAVTTRRLEHQFLGLPGGVETNPPPPDCFAGLSGDFDDQGISFGVLQWNIGQGSLQPLLAQTDQNQPDLLGQVFGLNYSALVAV